MTTRLPTILTPLAMAAALSGCGARSSATIAATDVAGTDADRPMNPLQKKKLMAGPVLDSGMMAATPSAKQFADLAAKGDAFEIAAARLAQTNGASPAVKAFAAKMIAAHTDSTARITRAAAAARPAIVPDASLGDTDYPTRLAELRKLRGAAFDRAYVAGQVDAHNQALSLFQLYASGGDAPALKAAATAIIPAIRGHQAMVRALGGQ